ncbi:hypothetical protein [Paraburkholderia tropica]|uniref:hypothetical protein n=1 Tax=Paraburkholderia tropica TaxID=92647 RepID=UPI002AB1B261|nr:hypothetical protein [Paraburkholderia tropica]
MQHAIISALSSLPFLVSVTLATILAAFFFWLRADSFRFTAFAYKRWWAFGNDHRAEFQRLTKESGDSTVDGGLVQAELTLCTTFKSVISGSSNTEVTAGQFGRAKNYLKITQQTDIHPPSMMARVGLFVLILAESVGTGYVLAPWMSTEITPSQANLAAGVLALAVAIVLALLTHTTGAEMAKFSHFRKRHGSEGLEVRIDLGDDQDQDAYYIDPNSSTVRQNPLPRRFANRVDDPGVKGPILLVVSGAIIIAIMVAIYVIRVNGVESEATRQIVSMETNGVQGAGDANPFDSAATSSALPPSVAQAQQASRKDVAESLGGNYKVQGIAASLMLALIYLVTQFTAFIVAFKSTFSGQGEAAYDFTRNQPSFETFRARFLQPRITRAESFLTQLREARKKRNHRTGTLTFEAFLKHGEQREEQARDNVIDRVAADVATGKSEGERELRYELALKNHNFSSSEQDQVIKAYQAAILRTDGIRSKPTSTRALAQTPAQATTQAETYAPAHADEQAALKAAQATIEAARARPTSPVQAEADIDALANAFAVLPDNVAKGEFLEKQATLLSSDDFAALREEIKRRKRLAKTAEKYSDLLDD